MHKKPRIVVVEADRAWADGLTRQLEPEGFEIVLAEGGQAFRRVHVRGRTDLILLNPQLPEEDGMALCRQLRASGDDTPVIMLSERATEVDRIVGLEIGADDYLGKPFHPRELLARIKAVLRRRPPQEEPGAPARSGELVHFGPFELDLRSRQLKRGEHPVPMTTGEFSMLKALARHPRQPLSRDQLAQMARGREFGPFDRSLDVQISRLRRMVEEDPSHPRFIQTVWGVGYVFVPDDAAA